MIKYYPILNEDKSVIIGCDSALGFFGCLYFSSWEVFMSFYNDMTEIVQQNQTPIPDVFIEGMGEGRQ